MMLPSTSTDSPSAKSARRTSSCSPGGTAGLTRTRTFQRVSAPATPRRLAGEHGDAVALHLEPHRRRTGAKLRQLDPKRRRRAELDETWPHVDVRQRRFR